MVHAQNWSSETQGTSCCCDGTYASRTELEQVQGRPSARITYLERNPFAYPRQEIMHEIAQALGTPATELLDTSKADGLSTEEQMLFRV